MNVKLQIQMLYKKMPPMWVDGEELVDAQMDKNIKLAILVMLVQLLLVKMVKWSAAVTNLLENGAIEKLLV